MNVEDSHDDGTEVEDVIVDHKAIAWRTNWYLWAISLMQRDVALISLIQSSYLFYYTFIYIQPWQNPNRGPLIKRTHVY